MLWRFLSDSINDDCLVLDYDCLLVALETGLYIQIQSSVIFLITSREMYRAPACDVMKGKNHSGDVWADRGFPSLSGLETAYKIIIGCLLLRWSCITELAKQHQSAFAL